MEEKKSDQEAPDRTPRTPAGGSDGRRPAIPPMTPQRTMLAWGLVIGLALLMVVMMSGRTRAYAEMAYSPDFLAMLDEGLVTKVEAIREVSGVTYVRGERAGKVDDGIKYPLRFKVYVPITPELEEMLLAKTVPLTYGNQSPYLIGLLTQVVPIVLLLVVLYFVFMRQVKAAGHGAMSFGKSRAKRLNQDRQKVTFENVAGIEEAKEEVLEIIEYLRDPSRFTKLGGRIPKGVLLMGPPGTGKTLLAKAIAGEADVPFFSISGSDFVEMFVGVGASRVRDMFEQGKRHAPCIIFIDEIDAVGRSRFTGIGGGHDEREQTLNALLVEMDGFETSEGVIILAATNRPDVLDQALMRPGRFDRQIVIDLPTLDGREAILKIHAERITLSRAADLRRVARGTPGFSGADLANLLNEAALLAAREEKAGVELADLEEARDKVRWGRERRGRVLDDKEKRTTAYHEAGHAVVMVLAKEGAPLHKVTIIPRGVAYLGVTMQLPEKDCYLETRTKLLGILDACMGGRIAEELFLDDITSGARSDLREATRLARMMVCDWGMSDSLGPRTFGAREELMFLGREVSRNRDYSERTAQSIDAEIETMLRASYDRARKLLEEHSDQVKLLAETLLERESLDGQDAIELVKHGRILDREERAELYPDKFPPEEESVPPEGGDATEGADATESADATPKAEAEAGPDGTEEKPVAKKPAAKKPVAKKPAAKKPVTETAVKESSDEPGEISDTTAESVEKKTT